MSNRRFKAGSGCFTCRECGKLTRDTGNGEASLRMCTYCVAEAELYNELQDGHIDGDEYDRQLAELKAQHDR